MAFQVARPIRLLHVADTNTSFEQIALPLLHAGHALATAPDQGAALESIRSQPWDVVLIDLADLEASLTLVGAIQQHDADLPVIVLSSPQAADVIERGFAAGAYDWLWEPPTVPLIEAAIGRAAERRRLLQARQQDDGPCPEELRHKVNNQLSSIIGLAQLHEMDAGLPHELIQDLQVIIQSARHIRDLLRQSEDHSSMTNS